jgi:hypothetical protein
MAPDLEALQRGLANRILDPSAPLSMDLFATPVGVDVALRLGIHTEGYPARITESLRESFPAIANILGETEMASLAERYIAQLHDPPRNLNYIGRDFAEHLGGDPCARDLCFLPDLARFEWAVGSCFHARLDSSFDLRRCVDWTPEEWERVRIEFQPGSDVVRSPWPLLALRATRDVDRESIDLDLTVGGSAILVHRIGCDVATEAIDEPEAHAFDRLRAGASLGQVASDFADSGVSAERVTRLFARWVSIGLVRDCVLAET